MAEDHYHIHVADYRPDADFVSDNADAVHPVAASRLGAYLAYRCGPDIPNDDQNKQTSLAVLEALAACSTDERLAADRRAARRYTPRWLSLAAPLVSSTNELGRRVEAELTEAEQQRETFPRYQDLAYILGLFDMSSFIVAGELQLPHPRYSRRGLMEQSRAAMPHNRGMIEVSYTMAEALNGLSTELTSTQRRLRAARLILQGDEIIANTEINLIRFRALLTRDLLQGDSS